MNTTLEIGSRPPFASSATRFYWLCVVSSGTARAGAGAIRWTCSAPGHPKLCSADSLPKPHPPPSRSQRPAPHFCHAAHWYPASMPHPIRSRATPWKTIVLVCGKCARKLDGGYGPEGKDTLRSTLRAELKGRGHGREVRIIETRCMGICPKEAVTMVNASNPGAISVVPKGTPIAAVMAQIIVTP